MITPQGKVWTHGYVDDFLKDAGEKGPRKSLSWVPTVKMPCLPRPLADMQNYQHFAEIKKYATTFVNHFKTAGQKLGEGCMELWNLSVPTKDLVITNTLIIKSGYSESDVCMEKIVPWSALAGTSVARGPKTGSINYKISWLGVLKILLELIFVGLDLDPSDHIDPSLIYDQKELDIQKKKTK